MCEVDDSKPHAKDEKFYRFFADSSTLGIASVWECMQNSVMSSGKSDASSKFDDDSFDEYFSGYNEGIPDEKYQPQRQQKLSKM